MLPTFSVFKFSSINSTLDGDTAKKIVSEIQQRFDSLKTSNNVPTTDTILLLKDNIKKI